MEVITTRQALREYAARYSQRIGFVPTMGSLHEGHLSLVERAQAQNEKVVVSIFVNPTQFNDPEDFEKYPVAKAHDKELLERAGVDLLFMPSRDEIYSEGNPTIRIEYPHLMDKLCGAKRAGHFEGVLLIVHNLFMWLNPARAYFGLKDYQQFFLIQKMARDLEFTTEIVGCPLVREKDGLAMSSRNVRLSSAARQQAVGISQALFSSRSLFQKTQSVKAALDLLRQELARFEVEYATLSNAETLEILEEKTPLPKKILIAVAVVVDGVRLIDNVLVETTL